MKKHYVYPVTTTADTMSLAMLCASGGGGGITPSYENPNLGGGDPNEAIYGREQAAPSKAENTRPCIL